MTAGIDHIVVTVADLDVAARQYEALGFTLTPRAEHPWGTANRLVQFEGLNFIELLEVGRPQLLVEHRFDAAPPHFSFGAYNRDFLSHGCVGGSMVVLRGSDSAADVARFTAAGLSTYAPFDFARKATLPDGRTVDVAFSLAFATATEVLRVAFFTSHNRFPENFWKPAFAQHANGASSIREAIVLAHNPKSMAGFLAGFAGVPSVEIDGAVSASCGPHALTVLTPDAFKQRFSTPHPDLSQGPRLAAIVIATSGGQIGSTDPAQSAGLAISWVRA